MSEAPRTSATISPTAEAATPGLLGFVRFCDAHQQEFTPRSPEAQRRITHPARLHTLCIHRLREGKASWEALEQAFPAEKDLHESRSFFNKLRRLLGRRRTRPEPAEVVATLVADAKRFNELADSMFVTGGQRDLLQLDRAVSLLTPYEECPERTFALLYTIAHESQGQTRRLLEQSKGFCELLQWGGTRYLTDFVETLQERFQISREAIKDAAAQALARELGETESNLQGELATLQARVHALESELNTHTHQVRQDMIAELLLNLQSRPNPVLDQVLTVYLRLQDAADKDTIDAEQLNILIVFETLLEAFRDLGIEYFPPDLAAPLSILATQLDEYQYLEGSTFAGDDDRKRVRCVRAGWRAHGRVVTPACVSEIPTAEGKTP